MKFFTVHWRGKYVDVPSEKLRNVEIEKVGLYSRKSGFYQEKLGSLCELLKINVQVYIIRSNVFGRFSIFFLVYVVFVDFYPSFLRMTVVIVDCVTKKNCREHTIISRNDIIIQKYKICLCF